MHRLSLITDWEDKARNANYRASILARACKVSPRHLRRYIFERFGCSTKRWLGGLRLNEAARLIVMGKREVKEAAFTLGFRSLSEFYRQFKSQFAATPVTLRRHGGVARPGTPPPIRPPRKLFSGL